VPVTEPVIGAMREVMVQDAEVVAVQDGASVTVNDQDCPAVSVLFGEIVTEPFGAPVPIGDVVMPHPAGGAGIATERTAMEVVPKLEGTRIVQVSVP
jgi:hypothetical protein